MINYKILALLDSYVPFKYCNQFHFLKGAHGSVVVKALCYKPEGRGFDIR
jgi:hypothetical protein